MIGWQCGRGVDNSAQHWPAQPLASTQLSMTTTRAGFSDALSLLLALRACLLASAIHFVAQARAMSAAAASAISAAPAPAAHSAIDIAALQHKIAELEEEIRNAKNDGAKWNDPALMGLRAQVTALQEKENLLLKSQSDAGSSAHRQ